MKNCWAFLLLAALLQSFVLSALGGGGHHGQGSGLAHILAAGLIVQLLGSRGHHHGHEGRHNDIDIHSDHSPYGQELRSGMDPWAEEHRAMTPEATLSSSNWAQRAPMDIAYSHSHYNPPMLESYNVPHYQQQFQPHYQQHYQPQHQPQHAGVWRM